MENSTLGRYTLLNSMHTIVQLMNDEGAYFKWIDIIPDCASPEELMDCAESDEILADAIHLFHKLVHLYAERSGYCIDGICTLELDERK